MYNFLYDRNYSTVILILQMLFSADGDKDNLHALKVLTALYLHRSKKSEDSFIHLYEE